MNTQIPYPMKGIMSPQQEKEPPKPICIPIVKRLAAA